MTKYRIKKNKRGLWCIQERCHCRVGWHGFRWFKSWKEAVVAVGGEP